MYYTQHNSNLFSRNMFLMCRPKHLKVNLGLSLWIPQVAATVRTHMRMSSGVSQPEERSCSVVWLNGNGYLCIFCCRVNTLWLGWVLSSLAPQQLQKKFSHYLVIHMLIESHHRHHHLLLHHHLHHHQKQLLFRKKKMFYNNSLNSLSYGQ